MDAKMGDKSKLNIIIDMIMLMLMLPIAGIGLLMKYVLLPGFERNVLYGNDVDLEFLGFTHHEWGSVHLLLSVVFLVLLVLHLVLHWKMIVALVKWIIPIRSLRISLVSIFSIFCLISLSFPLFVKPEIVEKQAIFRNRKEHKLSHDSSSIHSYRTVEKGVHRTHQSSYDEIKVDGSQTLRFVAEKYQVPVAEIATDLKIPVAVCDEKLGRLKKQYPFNMDDVRASITRHKK